MFLIKGKAAFSIGFCTSSSHSLPNKTSGLCVTGLQDIVIETVARNSRSIFIDAIVKIHFHTLVRTYADDTRSPSPFG